MDLSYGHLPEFDLDEICFMEKEVLESLSGARITIFGGTGFVGKWLVSTLLIACDKFRIDLAITVVGRNSDFMKKKLGVVNNKNIDFIQWDFSYGVLSTPIISDLYFMGATPSNPSTGSNNFDYVHKVSINATNTLISNLVLQNNKARVINLSSGAVFGNVREPVMDNLKTGVQLTEYGNTKFEMETLLNKSLLKTEAYLTHARLFAFAGPYISLEDHFAVGNFMNDGIHDRPIQILGNPMTERSYMHPRDLVRALLLVVKRREIKSINLGSATSVKMLELAQEIDDLFQKRGLVLCNLDIEKSIYYPDAQLLTQEIKLGDTLSLSESLLRWKKWLLAAT